MRDSPRTVTSSFAFSITGIRTDRVRVKILREPSSEKFPECGSAQKSNLI